MTSHEAAAARERVEGRSRTGSPSFNGRSRARNTRNTGMNKDRRLVATIWGSVAVLAGGGVAVAAALGLFSS